MPDSIATEVVAEKPEKSIPERMAIQYHFEYKKVWNKKDSFEGFQHQSVLAAINRVDIQHLQRLDSFLVPDKYVDSLSVYFPFPTQSEFLSDIHKIIIFSYPTQSFAAYEDGNLILSGPTNMGKKASKTPLGLFFCNWKAKETRSTVDNDWILKWNFNVSNRGGVGFHQYDLPGYPVSHSCMRLWAEQAEFLYSWAEQWKLGSNNQLLAKGTPVIVYGEYPFGHPRPWFALAADSKSLDINEKMMEDIVSPHKAIILEEQQKRLDYLNKQSGGTIASVHQ
ncbi:MAG: L,D-transpeptidase [Bacteroidota bacterium]